MEEALTAFRPAEMTGEWPPEAVKTPAGASGGLDALVIDRADPRVVISAELVDYLVDHPHPAAFVDLTGCDDYTGALLKIRGVNRNVVYRLAGWYPSIRAFLGEFT